MMMMQQKKPELKKTQALPPNRTGMPAQLKTQFERASGLPLDDVRVHYNSESPADFDAGAYALGNHVYLAPGQQRLLPHELGHVLQYKSRALPASSPVHGMSVCARPAIERQADEYGACALRGAPIALRPAGPAGPPRVMMGGEGFIAFKNMMLGLWHAGMVSDDIIAMNFTAFSNYCVRVWRRMPIEKKNVYEKLAKKPGVSSHNSFFKSPKFPGAEIRDPIQNFNALREEITFGSLEFPKAETGDFIRDFNALCEETPLGFPKGPKFEPLEFPKMEPSDPVQDLSELCKEIALEALKFQEVKGSKRLQYMGPTPSKSSDVGQRVIDRQLAHQSDDDDTMVIPNLNKDGKGRAVLVSAHAPNEVISLSDPKEATHADMGHLYPAVTFWNEIGRYTGARSVCVRAFMNDSNNYRIQYGRRNCATAPHEKY